MQVNIRMEAGYDLALYGMSLSFKDRAIDPKDWWDNFGCMDQCPRGVSCGSCKYDSAEHSSVVDERYLKMKKVATANANRGLGHDKFKRQVMLWVDIEAPRFWWSEMDTYKVGTVAQSESTMHTLLKRGLVSSDFENHVINAEDLLRLNELLSVSRHLHDIEGAKGYIPESYLQRRLVTLNYEVLSTVIKQRAKHKLPQWHEFISEIYKDCEHPELLPENPYDSK